MDRRDTIDEAQLRRWYSAYTGVLMDQQERPFSMRLQDLKAVTGFLDYVLTLWCRSCPSATPCPCHGPSLQVGVALEESAHV